MLRILVLQVFCFLLISFAFGSLEHDIELAQRFLVLEKYDKAAEVLEKLYANNPDNSTVQNMLVEAYRGAKKYEKLDALLQSMILRNPKEPSLWVELGENCLALNKPKKAMDAFDRAIKLASSNGKAIAIQIHQALMLWGYIDDDIEFIKDSRKRLKDDGFLALDLARLYEIKGRFDDAVSEYAKYLAVHPDRFSDVERRIDIEERTEEELLQLRKSLPDLFKAQIPEWQPWRLMGIVEQKLGNYQKAFESFRKAEDKRQAKFRGTIMSSFTDDMLRIGEFEYALKGAMYLLENCRENMSRSAYIYVAKALRGLGRYEEAIAYLDSAMSTKGTRLFRDASVLKARILLDDLHELDEAERTIEPLFKSPRLIRDPDAAVIKGEILIRRRKFARAKEFLLDAFDVGPRNGPIAYLLAMTYFFSGSDDSAKKALHGVVSMFPESEVANDAVEILLVMQTAPEDVERVREPIYLMFTNDTSGALSRWEKLSEESGNSQISDYILWKLGQCQLAVGDTSAVGTMRQIVERYPESFYAPLALETLADEEMKRKNTAAATEIYTRIINEYPEAVNIERVRAKLQDMSSNL